MIDSSKRVNLENDTSENPLDLESLNKDDNIKEKSISKIKLRSWLNKSFKIEMTDGRILIGIFLCTDRDGNIILGSCHEYHKSDVSGNIEDPRILGLVMVPGRHIVSIHLDNANFEIM